MLYKDAPPNFQPKFEVSSLIFDHKGTILLLLRHLKKPQGGTWCLPAGKLEGKESPLATAVREASEETGITVAIEDVTHCHTVYVRYKEYDLIYHIYRCKLEAQPAVSLKPDEHTACAWTTPLSALDYDLIEDEAACLRLVYGIEARPIDIAEACREVLGPEERKEIASLDTDEALGMALSALIEQGVEDPEQFLRDRHLLE